jgi:hypothetical protein
MRTKENIINENTRLKMEVQRLMREIEKFKKPQKYGIIRRALCMLRKIALWLW